MIYSLINMMAWWFLASNISCSKIIVSIMDYSAYWLFVSLTSLPRKHSKSTYILEFVIIHCFQRLELCRLNFYLASRIIFVPLNFFARRNDLLAYASNVIYRTIINVTWLDFLWHQNYTKKTLLGCCIIVS